LTRQEGVIIFKTGDVHMENQENYYAQKVLPHLRIPLTIVGNKEFIDWIGTFECKVWFKMFRHLIRGEMLSGVDKKLYNNYYEKGKICMYKDQKEIAEFLETKNVSYVSAAIKNMVKKGIIIAHKDKWNNRGITVYELGTHDMGPSKHENLHLFIYFTKLKAQKELEKTFGSVVGQ
jgi:hypothetical protein